MILAALALLAAQQAAAPPANEDYEEVVVTARVGRVALIFDRGADGRLRNCRVFRSSGVGAIDAKACSELPDCITDGAGKQYCGDGTGSASLIAVKPNAPPQVTPTLGLGKLLEPEPPKVPAVGPLVGGKDDEDPNRLGKLPPPPKDQSTEPAIRFGGPAPANEDKPQ